MQDPESDRGGADGDAEQKGAAFRALHEGEPFLIPNPWDAGTAKVMAALGFKALATTSGGFAFTLGRLDGQVTLDEVVEHTARLAEATEMPVSVDIENGYGPEPEQAALAITRAAEAGAVGGSIEDYDRGGELYGIEQAVERVSAAAEAAKALDFPFTLTGAGREPPARQPGPRRHDRPAAGLRGGRRGRALRARVCGRRGVKAICDAVSAPVNVLARPSLSMSEVVEAGAQRVSVGSRLTWVALARWPRPRSRCATAAASPRSRRK